MPAHLTPSGEFTVRIERGAVAWYWLYRRRASLGMLISKRQACVAGCGSGALRITGTARRRRTTPQDQLNTSN